MTGLEIAAVCLAGIAAGAINAVVGSGTLITFPTLLAFGVPPVTANVSNTIGLVPGSVTGAIGYRRELAGQRRRLLVLGSGSVVGGAGGALLLLGLPESAFQTVVPVLIGLGCLLVLLQPRISAVARSGEGADRSPRERVPAWVWVLVMLTGVYGGYFGAAQGVLLVAVLGIGIHDDLQRLNGTKNVLAGLVNGVAAIVFIAVAHVDWLVVALIAGGSIVGGMVGATLGRRLPALVLRLFVVVVGLAALLAFLVTS
ncbi:MAG: Uncharacterized UPF0721 integral membrane protein [uncultured Nocardioidaceae bacterium]|uniref:Probable membrane transporter protein n=1 Tax=uncultured Nocardioidaceae bacterium TaxID=253824 RepID=A0A6J4L855_9ACTN|nr:MAG: Uncharacterized UPF0721 integral membrane protein [uncultured Nocardioidaceae bacterium]